MARLTLVQKRGKVRLEFSDREQVWDALFVVDVVLWVVKRFLHLASPWTWLYEVFTNGYFVLWLIYEWRIRNHYFKFELQKLLLYEKYIYCFYIVAVQPYGYGTATEPIQTEGTSPECHRADGG